MKKINIILTFILALGTLYHASFLHLNEVMKIADSFAYLQMSYFLQQFSVEGLGNGWFGFVYSFPIALANLFIGSDFTAAKITNLFLFNISALLLWNISRQVLSEKFSYIVVTLFFLSPTLLHFNIHVLSENIYIPLFLGIFLLLQKFVQDINMRNTLSISCLLGLMYLTRAEAFIYIGSIGIIGGYLLWQQKITIGKFAGLGSLFLIMFFVFISPYLFHLHTLTGEWGLTNKGASNLRQAELRGQERMDDAGFEKAVAELTPDKQHLIAGFAGGMPYDTPQIQGTLTDFITHDPVAFIQRVGINQKKLFTQNIPEIFLGKSPSLYFSDDARFSHIFFLLWCFLPLCFLLFGIKRLFTKQRNFAVVSLAFFIPACIFFTLFFTLNRYFLIFLPLLLICFVYGIYSIHHRLLQIFAIGNLISILLLSTFVYYNTEAPKDEYYNLKKEAGEWLAKNNDQGDTLKIMERFPIVTYYSGSKTRYITPYTHDIGDMSTYGTHHNIHLLVVDTMDFKTYRPELIQYLENTPQDFSELQSFHGPDGQKVILYELKK